MELTDEQISEWMDLAYPGHTRRDFEVAKAAITFSAHNAGAQEPVAWHSIPDTPPVESTEWYGDQFSAPVLLHDGEKILQFIARWSFPEEGWVDAQFSDGPSPDDYEHLNAKRMRWMLLSAVAHYSHPQPMPQTDAARDALDAKRYRCIRAAVLPFNAYASGNPNWTFPGYGPRGESFDAAIDAEIERGEREGGK